MTSPSSSDLSNLEKARELYTEVQRNMFYAEYGDALTKRRSAMNNWKAHVSLQPGWWKFWKRPPPEWFEKCNAMCSEYHAARDAVVVMESAHPLLADIYEANRPLARR